MKSQAHEGGRLLPGRYDEGGFSGRSLERPALQQLLEQVRQRKVDVIVVYKVDRLTRSLADFAKLVKLFDGHGVSFVSVTQAFNATTSMGRLTLNVLLSFAQFEREVTGERIRHKIAASKKKGIWMGGVVPLGYRVESRALHIVPEHATLVRDLFARYPALVLPPGSAQTRPMKVEDSARILRAIGKGRAWMDELATARMESPAAIASREILSERAVRMTLSLAHLSPGIVKTIIDGRLPRGIGIRDLADLSPVWSEQERALGM